MATTCPVSHDSGLLSHSKTSPPSPPRPGLSMAGQQAWAEGLGDAQKAFGKRQPQPGQGGLQLGVGSRGARTGRGTQTARVRKLFSRWIFLGFIPLSWIVSRCQEMECALATYNEKRNSHPLLTWCWLWHLLPRCPSTRLQSQLCIQLPRLALLNFWILASALTKKRSVDAINWWAQEINYQNNQRSISHSKGLWGWESKNRSAMNCFDADLFCFNKLLDTCEVANVQINTS